MIVSKKQKIIIINAIPSLIIAFVVSLFFATGGIGENFTNKFIIEPSFFLIIVIWFLGLLIGLLTKKVLISVFIMYFAVFIAFFIFWLI
ncbi:putative SAM-dependent methyltransferase [Bacillus sp. TS-2]|nr:putative SAM-dependent methyltransferase [Bacillus sp. TS-2]